MKVGQRLTLGFLIYALLLFIIGYVFISNRQKVIKLYNKLSIEIIPKQISMKNIKIKSRRMVSETYAFLVSKNTDETMAMENEKAFQQAKKEEEGWEENYKRIVGGNSAELEFVNDIHVAEEEIKNSCQEVFKLKKDNQLGNEIISKIKKISQEEDRLFAIIDNISLRNI